MKLELTAEAYAAIHLKVPGSGAEWLDDMIIESRKMDYAGQALIGLTDATMFPGTADLEKTAFNIAQVMVQED
jgi:hypothetical protein